jgi:hypothetical protein
LCALAASGCGEDGGLFGDLDDSKSDLVTQTGDFDGCVAGVALDSFRIRIDFEMPSTADQMTIYRDGIGVKTASSTTGRRQSFVDTGLVEGLTYVYTCEASIAGKARLGTRSIVLATVSVNPPVFDGIRTARTMTNKPWSDVVVTWAPAYTYATPAEYFLIYANLDMGDGKVNWSLPARAEARNGVYTHVLTDLGDELPYVFGVRACSAAHNCDLNDKAIAVKTADGGPPKTTGAVSVSSESGIATLFAPWEEKNGEVVHRYVYKKVGGSAPNPNLFIPNQPLTGQQGLGPPMDVTAFPVVSPPQELTITGIADGIDYHFIVQDVDSRGRSNNSTRVVTL